MDGLDVQQFISSQRSRLSKEKARLFEDDRSPRGIVPSGSRMAMRSDRLRQERQEEYQNFLKGKAAAPKSVAEIRRQMAREREQEIGSHSRQAQGQSSTLSDYDSMKREKLEEEKQYRGEAYERGSDHRPRRRWDDNSPPQQRVRFEDRGDTKPTTIRGNSRGWEEDEQALMSWARSRGQENKPRQTGRARTPESPRSKVNQDAQKSTNKLRSISAPVVHSNSTASGIGGVFGLGGRSEEGLETRRNKQKEYAETLRAQIREREEARERDRAKEELMAVKDAEEDRVPHESDDRSQKSSHDAKQHQHRERSPPRKDERSSYRPPPSRFDDHHSYYGPPSGPPYDWGSHYYPYYPPRPPPPPPRGAPNFNYFPPDPYVNPYYHPSYHYPPPPNSHGENPYFPPRHDRRRSPPRRHQWDDDDIDRDEYSTGARKREYREEREFESRKSRGVPPSRERGGVDGTSQPGRKGGNQRGSVMDKASYRAELALQMKEKKENELKAKLRREMEDSKKETEVYDPFGKGGCGAPVRDQHGNLVADLKQMRKLNEVRLNLSTSPSHQPASSDQQPDDSPRTVYTYEKMDEESQKVATHMTYRDFLKQQVEEKEKKKNEEKRLQMLEDQRELERLEKDRKKMEDDFKRERERERQREEEAKRKNEQMKREAEEKKREAAQKAEEEQIREAQHERELAEARLRALAEKMAQPLPQRRTNSPPIPTLRKKMDGHGVEASQNANPPPPPPPVTPPLDQPLPTFQSSSPPVPAVLKKMAKETQVESTEREHASQVPPRRADTETLSVIQQKHSFSSMQPTVSNSNMPHPRPSNQPGYQVGQNTSSLQQTSSRHQLAAPSATAPGEPSDILKQLAAMRMHLQSELAKKDAVYKPDPTGIFERARKQKPTVPGPRVTRPTKDSATLNALNQFTHLKYGNSARRDFLHVYPEPPDTESVLELQQAALLRHQEEQLSRLKAGERPRENKTTAALGYGRRGTDALASDSINLPLGNKDIPFHDRIQSTATTTTTSQGHMTSSHGHMTPSVAAGGAVQPNRLHPQANPTGRRRQWDGARVPSAGGQSQFSVATFDVDSMAVRNDERARRLDAILNAGSIDARQPPQDPQVVLHDFLQRTGRGASRQSEYSLDCETDFQRISSPHS